VLGKTPVDDLFGGAVVEYNLTRGPSIRRHLSLPLAETASSPPPPLVAEESQCSL
jgi:hypothetical protein